MLTLHNTSLVQQSRLQTLSTATEKKSGSSLEISKRYLNVHAYRCVCVCVCVCAELQHLISFYVVLSCVTADSNNTRNERDLHCDVSGIACSVSDVKFVVISTWHRNLKIPMYLQQQSNTFKNLSQLILPVKGRIKPHLSVGIMCIPFPKSCNGRSTIRYGKTLSSCLRIKSFVHHQISLLGFD